VWKTSNLVEEGEALSINVLNCAHTARWFAVYTSARHEKRIAEHFGQRQIEHFLPLYHVQHKWKNGCNAKLELPLFPGYIFVRIQPNKRVPVLEVPGVLSIVSGTGCDAAPLADSDINTLRAGLSVRRAEPHPLLVIGQRVRIRSGALAGLEGIVLRRKSGFRVVLTLNLTMQSIAVEVNSEELEPLADECLPSIDDVA
jgi:transcription antitermination factor NusG